LPVIYASGFDGIQQSYHVEIWIEKTTMNDVLLPLCHRYRVNLVTGEGEFSKIAAREFLRRAEESKRPARILYISDFDPAGDGMPIHLARKIEFYHRSGEFDVEEIKLYQIVLTPEQVKSYKLPRKPIKVKKKVSSNGRPNAYLKRIEHFENIHGIGATELDALEALYPGELAEIVEKELCRYIDLDLKKKSELAKDDLQTALDSGSLATYEKYREQIEKLEHDYSKLARDFQQTRDEFSEIVDPFQPKINQFRKRLEALKELGQELYEKIEDDLEEPGVDLSDFPLPSPDIDGDPEELLYDSNRDYFEQLEAYKNRRGGLE
jgi:hypothetical protein